MTTAYEKNPNSQQRPGSLTKIMTALVFQDWVTSGLLDAIVTVDSRDLADWDSESNAGLLLNDEISYLDLLYGAMVPSGNDAARCIARSVGALIVSAGGPGTSSEPMARFVQAMNAKAASLGMTNSIFADPAGVDVGNISTAADMAKAMVALAASPLLVTVSGTMTRNLTITGANSRAQTVTHTVAPHVTSSGTVPTPEFIAAKTGTVSYASPNEQYDSKGCIAMLWESPTGVRRVTVVMGAELPDPHRYDDVRRLIDYELARLGER